MNCECIYYNKTFSVADYAKLGKKITAKNEELYPITISRITKDIRCSKDYEGGCPGYNLKQGSLVLFVGGKYYLMTQTKQKASLGFPDREVDDFFVDLYNFDETGDIHMLNNEIEVYPPEEMTTNDLPETEPDIDVD